MPELLAQLNVGGPSAMKLPDYNKWANSLRPETVIGRSFLPLVTGLTETGETIAYMQVPTLFL
jgi:hypothetical protein